MEKSNLWSLRLGFSNHYSETIKKEGFEQFLEHCLNSSIDKNIPSCLKDVPKSIIEHKEYRQKIKNSNDENTKIELRKTLTKGIELRDWWIEKMITDNYPLREKMVCFWHNHFVSTLQKVKSNWWVYQHNQILRENAFGNLKELTKKIIKSNAMVRYLDNVDNKKGEINENLSRELLELFTIGIGNYTEDDIKNGAKALAGLGLGNDSAQYRKIFENNEAITYFGKTGNFKIDDLIDIIFSQKNAPYHITRKIIKWFLYDNPSEIDVIYYGDFLKSVDYELKPFLKKLFLEEYQKNIQGQKIKSPLEFIIQSTEFVNIKVDKKIIALVLRQQGMDLFNQPNVKGWDGGQSWLTTQIFLQRKNISDLICSDGKIGKRFKPEFSDIEIEDIDKKPTIQFNNNHTNKEIIKQLTDQLLFASNPEVQKDLEEILKYDFDAKAENANQAILRVVNYIFKTPEYQLI